MDFLYVIIGWIMKLCYSISFNNYILTLFIFALVMQVFLFYFGIKQQKSSIKLASIRPKEMAIRNKYRGRNDRATQQKMQMEIQDMYKAEGYSPTAGCLPLLIQFPIILALFGVVRMPLTYTTNLNIKSEDYKGIKELYEHAYIVADNQARAYRELLSKYDVDTDEYKEIKEKITYLDNNDKKNYGVKQLITDGEGNTFDELALLKFMQSGVDDFIADFTDENGEFKVSLSSNSDGYAAVLEGGLPEGDFLSRFLYKQAAVDAKTSAAEYTFNSILEEKGIYTDADKKDGIINGANCLPDFNFIGNTTTLDTPSYLKFNWLLLIPVLVFISSFVSAEFSRKFTAQPTSDPNQPNPTNSGLMRWGMPLLSTWFSFTFPAAIGIYWVFRSIATMGQQFILSKMYPLPKFSDDEMKKAISEVKQAKKRKKLVTIEVDEDDTTYDSLAISEERAEKIRRLREKEQSGNASTDKQEKKSNLVDRPVLKDDKEREE